MTTTALASLTLEHHDEILPWEASEIIGVKESTLTRWRSTGLRTPDNPDTPRFWKRFGRVYYSRSSCIEFRAQNTIFAA